MRQKSKNGISTHLPFHSTNSFRFKFLSLSGFALLGEFLFRGYRGVISGKGRWRGDVCGSEECGDGIAWCRHCETNLAVGKTDFGGAQCGQLPQPLLHGEVPAGHPLTSRPPQTMDVERDLYLVREAPIVC